MMVIEKGQKSASKFSFPFQTIPAKVHLFIRLKIRSRGEAILVDQLPNMALGICDEEKENKTHNHTHTQTLKYT